MTLENLAQNVGRVQESLQAKQITRLEWALAYAKLGYKIIPLNDDCPQERWEQCKALKCTRPKAPREGLMDWPNKASSDEAQINLWWQQWPNANLGVHCRKSGLVVPDLDVHDSNKNGIVNFIKLQGVNTFPNTPVQNTGTGGKHIFYKDIPEVEFIGKIQLAELVTDLATGVVSKKVIEQGIDIKSNGQCVLAPSIVHGNQYSWVQGYTPWDIPAADMPDWLVKLAVKATTITQTQPIQVPKLSKETREQVLLALTYISSDDYEVWKNVGMALKIHDFDIATWVEWSQKSGKFKPGDCEEKWKSFKRDGIRIGTIFHYAKEHGFKFPANYFSRNDIGNAAKLALNFGHILRWYPSEECWYVWTGKVWKADNEEKPLTYAKELVQILFNEATNTDEYKWAQQSAAIGKLKAMLEVSKDELAITANHFDNNPFLLNCNNGIIDLKTGELLPQSPEYFLTQLISTDYVPDAKAPLFERFFSKILAGSTSLINYMHKVLGYGITGDVTEQDMYILEGEGDNGKSVLCGIMQFVLGDYAQEAPHELLLSKREDGPNESTYRLRGKRFVVVGETPQGARLNESVTKKLTGGDRIPARPLYGHLIEFNPSHKLFMMTNDMPEVQSQGHAIWRRLKRIHFRVRIPKVEQDLKLLSKLQSEAEGILAWLVRGAVNWQQEGLIEPEEVETATKEYKEREDTLSDFLGEVCYLNPTATIPAGVLRNAYTSWCRINNEVEITKNAFPVRLREKGFMDKTTSRCKEWHGVGLNSDLAEKFRRLC